MASLHFMSSWILCHGFLSDGLSFGSIGFYRVDRDAKGQSTEMRDLAANALVHRIARSGRPSRSCHLAQGTRPFTDTSMGKKWERQKIQEKV